MKATTRIALDWAIRSFGSDHVYNFPIRALRLAEEAVELAQALEIPKQKMIELVEMVYGRPPGSLTQELGGVAMTAEILAAAQSLSLDDFFEIELRRVLSKPTADFSKRNDEKVKLGMTI